MKRFVIATIALALVTAPAFAQDKREPRTLRTDEQKKQDAEIDRAYQRALQATGGKSQPVAADPWGKVRSAPVDKR